MYTATISKPTSIFLAGSLFVNLGQKALYRR
jgi:hypothetical protein